LGNVGRVDERKNPLFQVRLLAAMRKDGLDARYLMVGDGDLKDETKALAESLGVGDALTVLPATSEPEAYYSALDLLVMPSITEGFGMTAIEAQCAGLPVVASDALPESVAATDIIRRISLDAPLDEWVAVTEEILSQEVDRASYAEIMSASVYNVERSAARMVELWEAT
jgi:glycosyltransferase involved in cell wall biosynthesis